jgi:hypothetical protein
MVNERVIRASEIGEYVYCHRAWWLRHIQGYHSANVRELAAGTALHSHHGRTVWLSGWLRVAAVVLVVLAIILALVSLLPSFQ